MQENRDKHTVTIYSEIIHGQIKARSTEDKERQGFPPAAVIFRKEEKKKEGIRERESELGKNGSTFQSVVNKPHVRYEPNTHVIWRFGNI